jgi:hypothetical protein
MNDTMSLLLATSILAVGGLGLFMYKSSDNEQKGGDDTEYNEDSLFGSGSFWGSSEHEEDNKEENTELQEDQEK